MDEWLISEWDYEKNANDIAPEALSNQSNKVVFWKCSNGHSWQKRVQSRYLYKKGCPMCDSLGHKFPEIAGEIYQANSEKIDPFTIPHGTNNKLDWICDKGHRWTTSVYSRTKGGYRKSGTGCPYCANKKVSSENSVRAVNPALCEEWDFDKNKETPDEILAGSHQKVWWKCSKGHSWQAVVKDRCIKGTGCGYCSAQTSRPEIRILAELSAVFGMLSPRQRVGKIWVDILIEDINLAIEYDGEFYHKSRRQQDYKKNHNLNSRGFEVIRFREGKLKNIGQSDINVPVNKLGKEHIDMLLRKIKNSAPFRYEKNIEKYLKADSYQNETYFNELVNAMPGAIKEQSLGHLYPDLLSSWDEEKNQPLSPFNLFPFTSQDLWWTCELGHSWQAPPGRRIAGNGCPFCRGTYPSTTNNLLALYPEVAQSLHKTLNGNVIASEITPKSNKKFWWQCPLHDEHVWESQVVSRTYKNAGCPYCSGNKLAPENTLLSKHPKVAKEWDFDRNEKSPDEISFGSGEKVFWRCSLGHRWEASVSSRSLGRGCPVCAGKKTIESKSLGALYPNLVAEISQREEIDVWRTSPGSHKKIMWKCPECAVEWSAGVRNRVGYSGKKGSGCPKCSKKNAYLNFQKDN